MPYATRIREREPDAQSACGRTENRQRDAFVREYLENLSAKSRDGVGLPSHTEQLGGHAVTHFNIPLTIDGYVYANGPTGQRANGRRRLVAPGSPMATAEDALTEMASLR